jgi:hypothetical protein
VIDHGMSLSVLYLYLFIKLFSISSSVFFSFFFSGGKEKDHIRYPELTQQTLQILIHVGDQGAIKHQVLIL